MQHQYQQTLNKHLLQVLLLLLLLLQVLLLQALLGLHVLLLGCICSYAAAVVLAARE